MKKAMIAMSGGVDSSVAAYLITQQGYEAIGVTMKLYNNEDIGEKKEKTCCSLDDVEDARSVANRLGIPLPQRFQNSCSIDKMGEWGSYYTFSRERVLEVYTQSGNRGVSNVDMTAVSADPMAQCRKFLDSLDLSQGDIVLFFPPYSALFWYDMAQTGKLERYFEVKCWFLEQVSAYSNVRVFDFQGAAFTADLDNYMDITHFSPQISDELVRCFASGDYLLSPLTSEATEEAIRQNIETLLAENPEIPSLRS